MHTLQLTVTMVATDVWNAKCKKKKKTIVLISQNVMGKKIICIILILLGRNRFQKCPNLSEIIPFFYTR